MPSVVNSTWLEKRSDGHNLGMVATVSMATFEDSKLRTKESRRHCHNRQVQMRSTLRSAPEMQGLQFCLVRPFGRHHVFVLAWPGAGECALPGPGWDASLNLITRISIKLAASTLANGLP